MFEVIYGTPKDVAIVYIVNLSACLLIYPVSMLVVNAVKGLRR